MGTKVITTTFQLRRDSTENWLAKDPVLKLGEPGYEIDIGKLKIGDGETVWHELDYIGTDGIILDDVPTSESENGVKSGGVYAAIQDATSMAYSITLPISGWTASGDNFVYSLTIGTLTCSVPPIIQCIENQEEYNNILSAEIDKPTHLVTFTSKEVPTSPIILVLTDIH